jgi:hypothetical protein
VGSAYLVMTALAVLIIILILSLVRLGNGTQKSRSADIPWRSDAPDPAEAGQQPRRPCPVCGTMIGKGETVHSVYYSKRGRSADGHRLPVEEIHTEVYGCPYCWPAKSEHPRTCPVCRKTLSDDGYLVARTFRKPGRKDHVHVIGCTECKRVR